MSPSLQFVSEVAHDVAAEDMSTVLALAALRAHGYTADPAALEEAVNAIHDRDGLRDGLVDPRWWLGGSIAAGQDALALAVARAEQDLDEALRVLVRPARMAGAA